MEEAYELVNAIDDKNPNEIKKELGDLLLQVVLISQIASDRGDFNFDDVAEEISKKIIRRHPQIFDKNYKENDLPHESWERIKNLENNDTKIKSKNILDKVEKNIPSILRSIKIQKKVSSLNFDWPNYERVLLKLDEEFNELKSAINSNKEDHIEEELGDVFFTLISLCRHLSKDPDSIIRKANNKFIKRFNEMENIVEDKNIKWHDLNEKQMLNLWNKAKKTLSEDKMHSKLPKTIFITGATSGFGRATAKLFNEKGWQTIITGRRADRLEELARELGDLSLPLSFDVSDRQAVKKAIENLPPNFNQISVLCNNAGLALGLEGADEANLDDWDQMVDTNIKGLIYATRNILPLMIENGDGHIINIGSVAGSYPYPGGNVYGGTKAFVSQFSLNLRADLVGKGINITSLEPGLAETEFSIVRFKGDEEKASQVYKNTRFIKPEDIAETIYWVATRPKKYKREQN